LFAVSPASPIGDAFELFFASTQRLLSRRSSGLSVKCKHSSSLSGHATLVPFPKIHAARKSS
jgi:hypothetical protein